MFDDHRSKKVIIVAHCLLNQNAISDGTADYPGQFTELIDLILANQIGLIQLPCPELICLGLERNDPQGVKRPILQENTRIRGLLCQVNNLERLQDKAQELVTQIEEYRGHAFQVLGLIGVNRSPSCGVETTTKGNKEVNGPGVFIELISEACRKKGQALKMIGVKTSQKDEAIKIVCKFIEETN